MDWECSRCDIPPRDQWAGLQRTVSFRPLAPDAKVGGGSGAHPVNPTYSIIVAYAFGGLGALEAKDLEMHVVMCSSRDTRLEMLHSLKVLDGLEVLGSLGVFVLRFLSRVV